MAQQTVIRSDFDDWMFGAMIVRANLGPESGLQHTVDGLFKAETGQLYTQAQGHTSDADH